MGTVGIVVLEICAGFLLIGGWYLWFWRYNRRKALAVLQQVKAAFAGHAQILGIHWVTPSKFLIRLRLVPNIFQRSSIVVQLTPREMPLNWIVSKIRKRQETLTFEGDFDVPPSFNLEVHNQRWCGRTRRHAKLDPERTAFEHVGPFVLTTRTDWQREITTMMDALVASRDSDFSNVHFRRTSPHFSAVLPLNCVSLEAGNDMFHVLRELADCAGASRF